MDFACWQFGYGGQISTEMMRYVSLTRDVSRHFDSLLLLNFSRWASLQLQMLRHFREAIPKFSKYAARCEKSV